MKCMKYTVNIFLFLFTIFILTYLYREHIQSDIVQYISIGLTLSVVFIGVIIFMENRHPTQTVAWLVVLGAFPVIGFIFYLLFGRNYRKERMFKKKFFLDKKVYLGSKIQE